MSVSAPNGTAAPWGPPEIGPIAGPFLALAPPVQNNSPLLSLPGQVRPVRQAATSYIPIASKNLTDLQSYYLGLSVPELVRRFMEMDDFRSAPRSTNGAVDGFLEDVRFAFENGNNRQRAGEFQGALQTLQAARDFNARMRDTRQQATHWAMAQNWRLVPHVEEALSDCRRSVLKELYRGLPIRDDLINLEMVQRKATMTARAAGLLPSPLTTTSTTSTTSSISLSAVDKYFSDCDKQSTFPARDWAKGEFFFPSLNHLLMVGLRGSEVPGQSWTHYNRGPAPGVIIFTQPSTVNYSQNLAGLPSNVTQYVFSNPFPTTVLLQQNAYSFNGIHWLPNPYPTDKKLEQRKRDRFQALVERGRAAVNG